MCVETVCKRWVAFQRSALNLVRISISVLLNIAEDNICRDFATAAIDPGDQICRKQAPYTTVLHAYFDRMAMLASDTAVNKISVLGKWTLENG